MESPHQERYLKAQVSAKACDKAILGYQNMDYETRLRVLGLVSLEDQGPGHMLLVYKWFQ